MILLYIVLALALTFTGSAVVGQFNELTIAMGGEPFEDHDGDALIGPDEYIDLNGNGVYDPNLFIKLRSFVDRKLVEMDNDVLGSTLYEVRTNALRLLGQAARPASEHVGALVDRAAQWAGGFLALLTLLVLIPFYLFFFLVEYPALSARLRDMVPPRYREQVLRITHDIGVELVAFLRGRLLCGAAKALLLWAGMLVLGIPYALPIALVSGLLSLVPFLGFLAGAVPASVLALTMPGGGTESLLWVLAVFGLGEAVEGGILFPLLLGKETGLHPVTLVVALLAGGALMGTLGVIIAIPLTLILKVLWRELGRPLYRDWANPPEAGASPPTSRAPSGA